MKLYYSPGACSIGIHVLLQEIGKPFQTEKVDLQHGQQRSAEFTGINPKSKVPVIVRDNGAVLTEFPAIAIWLARTNPDKILIPIAPDEEASVVEAMEYIVSTVHMHGFRRLFRPGYFAPSKSDYDEVKAQGRKIIEHGFETLDASLNCKDYIANQFSIADATLFYIERWATADEAKIALPKNCARHLATMMSRPAVRQVLSAEGLA